MKDKNRDGHRRVYVVLEIGSITINKAGRVSTGMFYPSNRITLSDGKVLQDIFPLSSCMLDLSIDRRTAGSRTRVMYRIVLDVLWS